mgnify:CR=1 FL=1
MNRAEAGKLDFQPEFLELQPFCHQVLEALQPSDAAPRSIQVALPGNFTTAYVDPKLFHSIVTNLLSNALKYSPPDSRVNLTLQRTSQALIVQVQDWGIGIPAEDQPRLYDVFHRGQNVGVVTGTGLGLAVVKTCVDLHGGQVEVESQVGVGTTFTVTIPQ